jgi:hypothetical protein
LLAELMNPTFDLMFFVHVYLAAVLRALLFQIAIFHLVYGFNEPASSSTSTKGSM